MKKTVRLGALAQAPGRSLKVDRSGNGAIKNVSVITTGPALGHGFKIDQKTTAQVARALDGIPGRWTHGGLSEDGLARHLGRWSGGRVENFSLCRGCELEAAAQGELAEKAPQPMCPECGKPMEAASRAVGDFTFSASAHKLKPDGLNVPAPVYLMQRAEEDPRTFGTSVVANFDLEPRLTLDDEGDEVEELVARLNADDPRSLLRTDFVADPAANPVGLHAGTGAMSEVLEAAQKNLGRMVRKLGAEETRRRALKFVDRYLAAAKKEKPMLDGKSGEESTKIVDLAALANPVTSEDDENDDDLEPGTTTDDEGADEGEGDKKGEDVIVTDGPLEAAAKSDGDDEDAEDEIDGGDDEADEGEQDGEEPEDGKKKAAKKPAADEEPDMCSTKPPEAPAVLSAADQRALAAEARVKQLEAEIASMRLQRATEIVDLARDRGAAIGVLMNAEDRQEIIEALTSSDQKAVKLGRMLLERYSDATKGAETARTANVKSNPAETAKIDLATEKSLEEGLLAEGVDPADIVKGADGRIDANKTVLAHRARREAKAKNTAK